MTRRPFRKHPGGNKASEIKAAVITVIVFATITFAGFCLFFAGDPVPPEGADIWSILCWIGILVGAIAAYCTCQALFDLFVAATIGNEWMIGIIMLLFLVCLIFAFVDGLALLID
ncbi:hypothetical protein GAO09_25960 [Rhizobiales bacterium RZME27]|uniref:Uncharacterized protein n=1 Tax=Endobacterium cereale TaxID=2663029 RepID=A0A6A8AJZ5_9HYPH|nr:hypothetical protein [Endobacterium cereale]MQY49486.1 hypothetical protein [Endobacterium cereale]